MLDLEEVRKWAHLNSNEKSSSIGKLFSKIDTSSAICKDSLFPLYLRVILAQEDLPNIYSYWKSTLKTKCFDKEWCVSTTSESNESLILTYMLNKHNIHYDSFNKILYDHDEMFHVIGEPSSNHEHARYSEYTAYNYMILDDKLMVSYTSFSKNIDKHDLRRYEILVESTRDCASMIPAEALTHVLEGYSSLYVNTQFEKVQPSSIPEYIKLLKHPVISLEALATIITHPGFFPMLESGRLDGHATITSLLAIKLKLPLDLVQKKYDWSLEFNLSIPMLIESMRNAPFEVIPLTDIEFSL